MKRWLVLAGAVALAGGAVAALLIGRSASDRAAQRRAVKAYATAIKPLAYEGGMIVEEEIKPRLGDIEEGRVTPQQFRIEAQRWIRDFTRIRFAFRDAQHPVSLDRAAALYDEALGGYISSVLQFIEASKQPTRKAITDAIHEALPTAEAADKTYDRARALLDKALKRVGLSPSQ